MGIDNDVQEESTRPPDVTLILAAFRKCRREDGSLSTDHYLCACNELIRLFQSCLGRGFNVVLGEVKKATKRLEIRRVSGAHCHYDNLDLMLYHETERQQAGHHHTIAKGTQSLLLIYRTLNFMLDYLQQLNKCIKEKVSFRASDRYRIYMESLGLHHQKFRQAANRVILTHCGGKEQDLKKLEVFCRDLDGPEHFLDELALIATPVQQRAAELMRETQELQEG